MIDNQGLDDRTRAIACAERARAVATELRSHANLTEMVQAQLMDVNNRTQGAALRVLERLQHIDEDVEAIVHAVDASAAESKLLAARGRLQEQQHVTDPGESGAARASNLARATSTIGAALDDRAALRPLLAELATHLERASPLAAALPFARCRTIVNTLTAELARTQGTIRAAFDGLVQNFDDERRSTAANVEQRCAAVEQQLAKLVDMQDATAAEIRQHRDDVGSLVDELLATLQLHDLTRQQVEHVAHTLAEVDRHNSELREVLLGVDFSKPVRAFAPTLEQLYAIYAMHLQRPSRFPDEERDNDAEHDTRRIEMF